jgi:hypothetical protein
MEDQTKELPEVSCKVLHLLQFYPKSLRFLILNASLLDLARILQFRNSLSKVLRAASTTKQSLQPHQLKEPFSGVFRLQLVS